MHNISIVIGKITTKQFDNFLIIPFSKKWLLLNDDNSIEFLVEVKEGKLVLSGNLTRLDRIKDIDDNVM